ncbi:MAG: hypothetical protein DMD37_02830 [Gemmatimonadetes bacterium]|nr:MAG: hypothetical protein DMD37_02830 [Gemmatimonadota bacterium]
MVARLMRHCDAKPMSPTSPTPPVILIAAPQEHSLSSVLQDTQYAAAVQVHTGTLALAWAPDLRPDTIILDADLPDMSGIDACRLLHNDLRIGHNVPILILASDKPTPEQRVTALRAGAWDFVPYPLDADQLSLKLQTFVHAKRSIDLALADAAVDPGSGLHSRPALARRARELGALMTRKHGGLACIVFDLDPDPADPQAGRLLVQTARVSDVVGSLGPTEFAVLAPGTDQVGALKLVRRAAVALRGTVGGAAPESTLRVGYDSVANLTYSPIDPVALLARAAAAVRTGKPEPDAPWVRRFEGGLPVGAAVAVPALDKRRAIR